MSLLTEASLVLTPNAYKEGKLYSIIPSNGNGDFTAVRATTATRVNSAGLVEVVPYNLLTWSNDFTNSAWTKLNSTILSSNNLGPNGTLTATRLNMPNASSSQLFNAFSSGVGTYTTSIWVRLVSGSGNFRLGFYDNVSLLTDSITVTATWQRFSVTKTVAAFTQTRGCWLYSNDLNQVIEVWGGQVVEGTQPLTYLKTETRLNIPRLDYSLGSCPNLLLEPQRTNLALRSEEFDLTTPWNTNISGTGISPTRTANSVISPSGVQNADTIVFNRGAGNTINDQCVISQTITVPTTGTYYFTCWMKATTIADVGKQVLLRCGNAATLQPITLTANWTRFETTSSVTLGSSIFQIGNRGTITTGNSVSVDLWGAQLEAGAYATSYIPTTTASVTRNADIVVNASATSIINSQQGTFYVNCKALFNGGSSRGISLSNGTYSNRIAIVQSPTTNTLLVVLVIGNTFIVNQSISGYTQTNFNKVAISWGSGNFKIFINGTLSNSFTGLTMPTANLFTRIAFDAGASFSEFEGQSNQMALFPTPLTDDQLELLTGDSFQTYSTMASYYNYTLQ